MRIKEKPCKAKVSTRNYNAIRRICQLLNIENMRAIRCIDVTGMRRMQQGTSGGHRPPLEGRLDRLSCEVRSTSETDEVERLPPIPGEHPHLIRHGCAVPPSPEKGRLWGPPVWRCATVFAENMVPCPSQTAPLKYRLSDISYPRQAGKLPQGEGSEVTTGGICARLGRGGFMDQVCIRQPESISLAIWKVDFRNSSG